MKPSRKSNIFIIFIISFGHMCHDIYTSFLSPILPILIKKLELSYTSAGFISVMLRLPSLFNPFIGAYAERFNLKYIVIISPTLTAVAMCLMGSTSSYYIILFLALIVGISSSLFHVPTPVLLKDLAGKRVGAAMSSFQIGGELSRTIGPIVVLAAVSLWTIEGIYRLIPIGFFMSFIFYFVLRNHSLKKVEITHGIRGSIKETFMTGRKLYIAITGILLTKSMTATILAAYLPVYMTSKGESLWMAGVSLSLVQGSAIIGVFTTGTLSDKFGCRKILGILIVLAPLSMLLFIYSGGGMLMFVSLILVGFTAFSSSPVVLALIQKTEFQYKSIANGLFMTINFMLSSIMIMFAGKISDIISIEVMFQYFAIASFIGIPFVFLLKNDVHS
jgi:MFS transporter, FSR family, fosmidomycin resistance protein